MPVVSRFLGIVIAMYWNDHAPAHFHAKYGEYEMVVHIATGVVEGFEASPTTCVGVVRAT